MSTDEKILPAHLRQRKDEGRKITMLSIYDYAIAGLADDVGLDTILVGDSLAMTALGYSNTVSVTLDEMLHHTRAVARAAKRAMVIADMPFMSYQVSSQEAVRSAGRFIKEAGADAVKVEGGEAIVSTLKAIHDAGIPVVGHIGLTLQSSAQLGGKVAQGQDAAAARRLIEDARALEAAGAFALIVQSVPTEVGKAITAQSSGPHHQLWGRRPLRWPGDRRRGPAGSHGSAHAGLFEALRRHVRARLRSDRALLQRSTDI